ncbi:2-C-methyl-D-erythritol 4-phosphate cytidylyltransferase [Prosthecobacter sp.]|uniref:2-C-methyl-D-erythritol 4-phosphate cytidylyltransferase n=1 Tax=Prosthecobacter sp. TaxID=1965333 RepID=UPI00378459D4
MTSAIIVAAGSSRRMGFNKLLAPLAGEPVLRRTLAVFQACDAIDEIIVVTSDALRPEIDSWRTADTSTSLTKITQIITGGAERHLSVHAGLQALHPDCDIVAVHDGARPLISVAQITRCVQAARTQAAVACARPMTETLKRCDPTGRIIDSIDRAHAWIMETPQVFQRPLLVSAYDAVLRDSLLVTDEVSAVQHLGAPVFVVENFELNPKITFPADILLAQRFVD